MFIISGWYCGTKYKVYKMPTRLLQYQERFIKLYSMLVFPVSAPRRLVNMHGRQLLCEAVSVIHANSYLHMLQGRGSKDGIPLRGFLLKDILILFCIQYILTLSKLYLNNRALCLHCLLKTWRDRQLCMLARYKTFEYKQFHK